MKVKATKRRSDVGEECVRLPPFVASSLRRFVALTLNLELPVKVRTLFFCGMGVLTLAGAAVRWHFLNYPMRYDETFYYLAQRSESLWFIATHWSHVLHSLLVRVATHFFGAAPPAVRLPAFVAGVMLIPLTGWLAWSLFRHRGAALLAALAACGSSLLVEYSVNARGYSLQAALATLASICTIHLMSAPANRRLWIIWGGLGALGAYAQPIMALPMSSLGAALVIQTIRSKRGSAERRHLGHGLVLGSIVCIVGTAALWLPVVATEGAASVVAVLRLGREVYAEYLADQGGMLRATWRNWIRHSNVVWQAVLVLGFLGFIVSAIRKRGTAKIIFATPRYLVPLLMLVVLPGTLYALGTPMVPPGWMFALPMFLACAMYGCCGAPVSNRCRDRLKTCPTLNGRKTSRVTAAAVAVVCLSAVATMVNVSRQKYLSTWDHELVDIEQILAECDSYGTERSVLIVRYHPATTYYTIRRGMDFPHSPESGDVRRVFIAVGTLRTLDELWNENVMGFSQYGPPRVWRRFSRSTVYVANRKTTEGDQHG